MKNSLEDLQSQEFLHLSIARLLSVEKPICADLRLVFHISVVAVVVLGKRLYWWCYLD